MTLGERIKACRQKCGMSQEKVAELAGVSRQAVAKWEANKSAPSTENLFKLAEIFKTGPELLLDRGDTAATSGTAEQIYALYKADAWMRRGEARARRKKNVQRSALAAAGYLLLYLAGRMVWCAPVSSSVMGFLFETIPAGPHSYLYGWLLSSGMFWYAAAVSVVPALWGKWRFSAATLGGFVLGLGMGMVFGPYPEGAFYGVTHYGWLIWGCVYLVSAAAGMVWQRLSRCREKAQETS